MFNFCPNQNNSVLIPNAPRHRRSLILDVGSGAATYINTMTRGNVCVDIGRPKVKPENFVLCDAHHLPFKEAVFSKVFFYDVIEHVNSPILCVREIFRVLCSGGELELSTPNPLHWRNFFRAARNKDLVLSQYEAVKYDHITTWTDAEMRNLLMRVGFRHVCFSFTILEATRQADRAHMCYDLPLFRLSQFFRRVTGRTMIVNAWKINMVSGKREQRMASSRKVEQGSNLGELDGQGSTLKDTMRPAYSGSSLLLSLQKPRGFVKKLLEVIIRKENMHC